MAKREVAEYLDCLKKRCQLSSKAEKTVILDELTKTAGYDRKHAILLPRGTYQRKLGIIRRPRRRWYTARDASILVKVCNLLDWICAKRVQPQIGVVLDQLAKARELVVLGQERKRLSRISPATIDRLLTRCHQRSWGKGRSCTKPGTLLKVQIPVRTFDEWDEKKVGFFEIDLVGHEGGLAKGDFAWTLNLTDVKTAWTEQVAVKNKALHS